MQWKALSAGLLLTLSGLAAAAEKDVEEQLSKMRDAYKAVKAAKFTSESVLHIEGEKVTGTIDTVYKSENKVTMRATNLFGMEGVIKVISNGKKISVSTPEEKVDDDFSIEAMGQAMPVNLEVMCFWDWKRQLSTEKGANMEFSEFKLLKDQSWNDKKWTVLEETAKGQGVFAKYWIDPKTHFIWRTEISDLESKEKVMDCTLKSLEVDIEVADSTFDIP